MRADVSGNGRRVELAFVGAMDEAASANATVPIRTRGSRKRLISVVAGLDGIVF